MSKDTKTKPKKEVIEQKSKTKESTLYYFYSQGCAFCKRIDPIVDDLNEYHNTNILKLDLSEKDNQGLKRELENKYDLRCGTPWLVDASNGNNICGAATKENIQKWVNGEKIPAPPKPKSPPPVPPKELDDKKIVDEWKNSFNKWAKENDHLPNIPKVEDMLERLRKNKEMMARQGDGNIPPAGPRTLEGRISSLEQKLDKLMGHLGVK